MTKLSNMPNIGKTLEEKLNSVGIISDEDLKKMGAKQAFLQIKSKYPDVCINHLYAIAGAVQGVRWHSMPDDFKSELRDFYNSFN